MFSHLHLVNLYFYSLVFCYKEFCSFCVKMCYANTFLHVSPRQHMTFTICSHVLRSSPHQEHLS